MEAGEDHGEPLAGLRVVEGATYVAVPSGAMTLAMLGAEVIRFDPIGGANDHRRAPLDEAGTSIYWESLNKGKRSVALDVRDPRGLELAQALITAPGDDAGIYVTNAVAREPLSYAALSKRRRDLVMVELSGYPDGRPAVDYTVNAEVGFPGITGPSEGPESNHALPAWDLLAGMHVAMSVLIALRRRDRSGAGARVALSLSDVALATTDHLGYLAEVQVNGESRGRTGDFVYGTFGVPFDTKDDRRVMVVALTPRQWSDLVQLTGIGDLLAGLEEHLGARFADEHDRYRHRHLLRTLLAPWFRERSCEHVLEELAETRVVAAPFRSFAECQRSPDVQDNPLFREVAHPRLGELLAAGVPGTFGLASDVAPVAPQLGADTEWALATILGLTPAEIGQLHDQGLVSCAPPLRQRRGTAS
jgi:2-methylfumaryl-CoA isomerase